MRPEYIELTKKYGGVTGFLNYARQEFGRTLIIREILEASSSRPPGDISIDLIGTLVKNNKLIELLFKATDSQHFEQVCQYIDELSSNPDSTNCDASVQKAKHQEHIAGLRTAFKGGYFGGAVDCLYEYLTDCDRKFYKTDPPYYGRFCAVVQSSGTGKSRTLIELMKKRVLGLYINVRPAEETLTYPLRDDIPANILAPSNATLEDYKAKCYAFFTAIFTVLRRRLRQMGAANLPPETIITTWSQGMCNLESTQRKEFFNDVQSEFTKLISGRTGSDKPHEKGHASQTQDTTYAGVQGLAKDISGSKIEARRENTLVATNKVTAVKMSPSVSENSKANDQALRDAYQALVSEFSVFFAAGSHPPKLVIAIDEVHMLGYEVNNFRRSHILCRIISNFSQSQDVSNWVIFASTTSKVADFSAPSIVHRSHRVSHGGQELFPPYCLFDWDQRAKPLGTADPWEVSEVSNIVGFGRPLWSSLAESINPTLILRTAREKLCGATSFNTSVPSQVLAVIGQRTCLDICFGHTKATALQVETVSSNLRVCLETTDDRLWQTTLYPSEPLLSCAAAMLLHGHPRLDNGSTLVSTLNGLAEMVKGGIIDMGQKGELASRLVYQVGKDLCVRTIKVPAVQDEFHLEDCKPIPVLDYLRFQFGDIEIRYHSRNSHGETVESIFGDWYINFSHWIPMSGPIAPDSNTQSHFTKWLARHWFRTCAIQCYHGQKMVDKLIPMFKFGPQQKPERSRRSAPSYDGRVSFIVISDRARQIATKSHLSKITPRNIGIPDLGQPYIAIQADLRVEAPKLEFNLIQNNSTTHCLRIFAAGIDAKTYKFLESRPDVQKALEQILTVPPGPKNPSAVLPLKARLMYGEYHNNLHMEWERVGGPRRVSSEVA